MILALSPRLQNKRRVPLIWTGGTALEAAASCMCASQSLCLEHAHMKRGFLFLFFFVWFWFTVDVLETRRVQSVFSTCYHGNMMLYLWFVPLIYSGVKWKSANQQNVPLPAWLMRSNGFRPEDCGVSSRFKNTFTRVFSRIKQHDLGVNTKDFHHLFLYLFTLE